MRWKRRLFESYEKSMNFKYDPEGAKEGLSFEVKEEKRGKTWILKKVLVPTLCSLAGVGIIFTSAHLMLQSASGDKNYGAAISSSDGNVANSMYTPKNDMVMPTYYPFTFSGMKLEFTYIKDINKLSFTCSSGLDVDCLTVKDNEVLLEFDKTNNSCLLENKKKTMKFTRYLLFKTTIQHLTFGDKDEHINKFKTHSFGFINYILGHPHLTSVM